MEDDVETWLEVPDLGWSPTGLGNITAREFVFRIVHGQETLQFGHLVEDTVVASQKAIAIATLLVAMQGDLSLVNECGFALEFACNESAKEKIENSIRPEELSATLRRIKSKSLLLSCWTKKKKQSLFVASLEHLLKQLSLWPKCKKSKFKQMGKLDLRNQVQSFGDNYFNSRTDSLILTEIAAIQLIDLARHRRVRELTFLPLTSVDDQHAFDWVIRFAIQNWADSLRSVEFKRMGTLDGRTRVFEFPLDLVGYLKTLNLRLFNASDFVTTNEILESALGPELLSISLGPNRLTSNVFDEIERVCVSLKHFFVTSACPCHKEFVDRAVVFKSTHQEVQVILNGQTLP